MTLNVAEIKNGEVKAQKLEFEEDYISIPLHDNAYEEHKKNRNKRVYKKFGKDYDEEKRKREQRELLEDLKNEFNERNYGGYGR